MDLDGCAAGGIIPAHLLSLGALLHRNSVVFRFAQPGPHPARNKRDIAIRKLLQKRYKDTL